MQLLPRFINLIFLKSFMDSKIFRFIFKFSTINSNLFVLFATIPPTLAAAFTITSGLSSEIVLYVEL